MVLDQLWLTEAQFSEVPPHLPTDTRSRARVYDRHMISGILQVLKSGGRWVDAPPEYRPKKTLYIRYVRWAAKGVWVDLLNALARADGRRSRFSSTPQRSRRLMHKICTAPTRRGESRSLRG